MILPDPALLRARWAPVDAGVAARIDPLALAGDDGMLFCGPELTLAGRGAAATLPLPRGLEDAADVDAVVAWLAAVPLAAPHDAGARAAEPAAADLPAARLAAAEPSPAVVALGALPFDRAAPGTLVVPSRVFARRRDGTAWVVAVDPVATAPPETAGDGGGADLHSWLAVATADTSELASRVGPGVGSGAPGAAPVAAAEAIWRPSGAAYASAVAAAVRDIRAGRLQKVVLARAVDLHFASVPGTGAAGPSPTAVVRRLWAGHPAFHPFSLPVPGGRFLGASPELIVARHGNQVTSLPLAGTVALPDGPGANAAVARLLASEKDLLEHRLVVEAVAAGLAARCTDVEVPARPSVVRLRSDARLGTLVRARAGGGAATALHLVAELHPTPAVGGVARDVALARIAELEPIDRGYWAGPVGWVDGGGNGEWVLAIRSTTLAGQTARVFAGAGIVAASDPDAELAETTVKLRPVVEALAPGSPALVPATPPGPPDAPRPAPPAGVPEPPARRR